MDNTLYVLLIIGAVGGSIAVVSGSILAAAAFRTFREVMDTLADLSAENRAGLEEMFKTHAASLENLKAIETCGVEGMRGVVARSQPRPSVLDDSEALNPPSPDQMGTGGDTQYIDVGPDNYDPERLDEDGTPKTVGM